MKVYPVYSSREVLQFTYDTAKRLIQDGISGDFIECGIAAGSQIGAMKQCCMDMNVEREIYGYDSFCGIPYAGENDETQPGIGEVDRSKSGLLETTNVSSHSVENVKNNFKIWELDFNNVHLIQGWFQDTLPLSKHKKIALLRLDGDLYESTFISLKYLLNKVQKGGIVIIDDYELAGCQKAVHKFIDRSEIINHLGIAYCIKK